VFESKQEDYHATIVSISKLLILQPAHVLRATVQKIWFLPSELWIEVVT